MRDATFGALTHRRIRDLRTEQVQLLNEFLQLRMIRVLRDRFVPLATPLAGIRKALFWVLLIMRHARYRRVNGQ